MNYKDLEINPDLKQASTLPGWAYSNEEVYKDETKTIFQNSWQISNSYNYSKEKLSQTGGYFTEKIADENILVIRDGIGNLKVLSNVCRHRASLLLKGEGNCATIKCPYHGWTYDISGKLIGQPEFSGVDNWDREKVSLPKLEHRIWGPFLFVKINARGPSFEEWLGKIPEDLRKQGYDLEGYEFLVRKEYEISCNWKVYVDNYLEGYHLASVHPGLFKEVDYKQYRVDTFQYYSSQYAPLKDSGTLKTSAADQSSSQALYYWLFPNLMLNFYPDQMHTSVVVPMGVGKTKVIFDWYTPTTFKGERDIEKLTRFNDEVQKEDMEICEAVQQGLNSRFYDRGRYSVLRENGVHHFHLLWKEFISK